MNRVIHFTASRPILYALAGSVVLIMTGCASQSSYHTTAKSPKITINSQGIPSYYLVKRGDTVSQIAKRYGLNYHQIAKLNQLDSQYTIYTGQWLKLWGDGHYNAYQNQKPAVRVITPNVNQSSITKPNNSSNKGYQSTPNYTNHNAINQTINNGYQNNTANIYPTTVTETIGYIYPSNNPIVRQFSNNSGQDSMMFSGKAGDPVIASQDGQVIYVGNGLPRYGNLIIIRHDESYLSCYAQNSQMFVKEGQIIKKGQKIANMSSRGLEFQIRENGQSIDPRAILGR